MFAFQGSTLTVPVHDNYTPTSVTSCFHPTRKQWKSSATNPRRASLEARHHEKESTGNPDLYIHDPRAAPQEAATTALYPDGLQCRWIMHIRLTHVRWLRGE